MSRLDKWVDNKIVQNLFIWFFLYLILLTTIQTDSRALSSLFAIFLLAPAVYINNLFILPLFKKNTITFYISFVLNIVFFSATSVLLISTASEEPFSTKMLINFSGIMVLAMLFASAIKIASTSMIRRQEEKEAELKLLKAQLNPHFLFNTLNNLYGLSVIKSDKLPNLMLKLSDLLRYSLYETKDAFVPLEKEIVYLENYMSLEKIRLEDKTIIQLSKTGNLALKKVAPMLLIVFVENAFKHLGSTKDGKSNVSVSINEKDDKIYFTCANTIDAVDIQEENLEKGRSGIGLSNVKRRLNLMYPYKYQLDIDKNDLTFNVRLTLEL